MRRCRRPGHAGQGLPPHGKSSRSAYAVKLGTSLKERRGALIGSGVSNYALPRFRRMAATMPFSRGVARASSLRTALRA